MNDELARLCPGCFKEKSDVSVCPHCGYDENAKRDPRLLRHRIFLHHGQYMIGRVLGKPGGFGITYLAYDNHLHTRVAIKEYFPKDLAGRDSDHITVATHNDDDTDNYQYGLNQFINETRTLARLDHSNIVRVKTYFEENGTAYLVMEFYDGVTLAEYLEQHGGKIAENLAVGIMMPILDGLREVHAQGFIHRDIKPQNIYLTTSSRPVLLDFGAARFAMGKHTQNLSVVLTPGYAPLEQYQSNGQQGPWTDVYASAAVLYRMVTGVTPPQATDRVTSDTLEAPERHGISKNLSRALVAGLAVHQKDRPVDAGKFQQLLLGEQEKEVKSKSQPGPRDTHTRNTLPPDQKQAESKTTPGSLQGRWWLWGVAAAILAGIAVFMMNNSADDKAWAQAFSADTIGAYEKYEQSYPSGHHAQDNKARLQQLREMEQKKQSELAVEQKRQAEEKTLAEAKKKQAEEKAQAETNRRQAEEKALAEAKKRQAEEKALAEAKKRQAEENALAEAKKRQAEQCEILYEIYKTCYSGGISNSASGCKKIERAILTEFPVDDAEFKKAMATICAVSCMSGVNSMGMYSKANFCSNLGAR